MVALAPEPKPQARPRPRIGVFIEWVTNEYADLVLAAIGRAADHADCDVLHFVGGIYENDFPNAKRHHPLFYLDPNSIDGALVVSMGTYFTPNELARVLGSLLPVPMCSVAIRWDEHLSVEVDDEAGLKVGIHHLISAHGRRRIACIRGPQKSAEAQARFAAYERALADHGLPFDPSLVASGDYVHAHGREAVRQLLDERHVAFDALVAANDSMALGAMRELQRRGIRVPEQVSILGFDDVEEARHAQPSLTTVRQPIAEHAELAFERLLAKIRGERVPKRTVIPSELVLRRSCGCLATAGTPGSAPPAPSRTRNKRPHEDRLLEWFHPLAHYLASAHPSRYPEYLRLCVGGASAERPDQGLKTLRAELADLSERQLDILRILPLLRNIEARVLGDLDGDERQKHVLEFCRDLSTLVAETVDRREASLRYSDARLFSLLLRNQRSLAQAVSLDEAQERLSECLEQLRIESCFLCLYDDETVPSSTARVVLAASPSQAFEIPPGGLPFPARTLLPKDFLPKDRRSALIQYPLFLAEEGARGYVVLERASLRGFVHDALVQQIFGTYRRIELTSRLIHEARLRETAERQRLEREMRIAQSIQTGILPRDLAVEGLEIAAAMVPASEVGGDYYDVIPHAEGCWFGIGDVAGHGLPAGLVMLMLQSVIGGLTRNDPESLPRQILPAANDVLVDNIRRRLLQDEHITMTLLRYHRSGRVVHAGAHEDILVYRARSREVQHIPTPGSWLGINSDFARAVEHREFSLEAGDVMVLYTDGISEARNGAGEMFGVERIAELLLSHSSSPVQNIRDAIVKSARAFMTHQDDDMTLLVARQK